MLKYVPSHETLKIGAKDNRLTLSWPGGSASYPTESVADFPVLPDTPVRAEGQLDGDTLIAAMLAALPYCSTKSARPVLNGITLVLGSPVEVASGDGFRMSHQVFGLSFPIEAKIILPSHSVAILGHVFAKTPRTPPQGSDSLIPVLTAKRQLHIALAGENKLRVDFGTTASVMVNLIEGSPPDWLQLIPRGKPVLQSHLFAPQLEAAVRRVQSIARDGAGIVRLVFNNGTITVSAQSGDQEISATLETMNTQGEPGRTALNYRYLLEYLSGKPGIVAFFKYDDAGPVVFQYQQSPRVLIMPMFVQWGDEALQTPEESKTEPEMLEEEKAAEDLAEPGPEATKDSDPEPVETVLVPVESTKPPAKRKRKAKTSNPR